MKASIPSHDRMRPVDTPSSLERQLMFTDEHKHVLILVRSLRFWVWCGVASVPAFGAVVYRAWSSFVGVPVLVGLVIAVGICVAVLQSLFRGRAITNTGIYVRRSEPVRFWGVIVFLVAMYVVMIWAILKVD
jgi:hypothetical protein